MSRPGIIIPLDTVSPLMERLKSASLSKGLAKVGARAVAITVRDHFVGLNDRWQDRRKNGGRSRSSNFYAQAANSVNSQERGAGAAVSIAKRGIAQRRFGGKIKPKRPGGFLAYPAADAPEKAYTDGPRAFGDLDRQLVQNPAHGGLQWALVRRWSQSFSVKRRKRRDGTVKTQVVPGEVRNGEVIFWLARSVYQRPDPSVLPVATIMVETGKAAVRTELFRRFGIR